jgi:sugar O-acyltransferase (sialic acid O-acetyltransferase NeuD family)
MQAPGFIFGCGAQGRVVLDILRAQFPERTFYFVDENKSLWQTKINEVEVIGGMEAMLAIDKQASIHIAIGNPHTRKKIVTTLKARNVDFLSAIHPSSIIMTSCKLGDGLMIGAGAIINSNTSIGDFCIINTGAVVEHDCLLEEYTCISPRACIGGRVNIKTNSFISSGAIVRARVEIGKNAIVGMGAIVVKNVLDSEIVYGNPAKIQGRVDKNFDWGKAL